MGIGFVQYHSFQHSSFHRRKINCKSKQLPDFRFKNFLLDRRLPEVFLAKEQFELSRLAMSLVVVGVAGCSGTGKTTLCAKISEFLKCEVISGDDYLLPQDQCPPLDLTVLPWPDGETPAAFSPKRHDTNCPGCIDWPAFENAVRQAIDEKSQSVVRSQLLLIESFLLLHSQFIVSKLNYLIRINVSEANWPDIIRRKWGRRHLGKASYQERGVTFEEYSVYWSHYVVRRFHECAAGDAARLRGTAAVVLEVDSSSPPDATVQRLLSTLPPR